MKDALRKQITSDDKFFFNAFQNAAMGMALADRTGQWLMVNRSLCELTGYSEEEFYKTTFQELIHPGNRKKELDYINSLLSGELESCQKEKSYFHRDGRKIYIQISVSLVKEKDGSPLFFIFQIQDITERKLLEKELVKQATIDMLTGINNRRHFFYLAERDILRCSRYNEPLVLLMIDIDHFKDVNDTYGHSIGDDALKKMVEVCRSEIRAFDNFGRIGGEEFGMLLTKADAKSGFHLAERLRKLVEQSVLITDKGVVKFTISIGGVAFSGNRVSLGVLMKQADKALYKAKETGRNKTIIMDGVTGPNEGSRKREKGFVRIQWNREYECGNQIIDTQHKNLFQLSNELLAAMLEPQKKTVCEQLMDELIEEIIAHFNTEESIIEAAGYPEFREHREIHKEMLALASDIIQGYKDDNIDPEDVFNFLAVHIVHEDMLEEDRKFFTYV